MCYTTLFISLHKDILDMDIETVDKFLKEFKDKARVFGIIFRIDRKKNMQALLDLQIQICRMMCMYIYRQGLFLRMDLQQV